MESEAGGFLDSVQLNYVIMLLLYSGIGSWLVERFTKNRADLRRERRAHIRENLELLDHMARLRDRCDTDARKSNVDTMTSRLMSETTGRIEELNRIAEEEQRNPARHYLILPTPRTPFGAFVSLVFAVAVYVAGSVLVVLGVAFFDEAPFSPLTDPEHMTWTLKMLGFSAAMLVLAFLARLLAYRLYNARTLRMRREPGES